MNGVMLVMRGRLLTAAGVAALAWGSAAFAQVVAPLPDGQIDTLREALVKTYDTNPTIMAQRQSLRATDENVSIAPSIRMKS